VAARTSVSRVGHRAIAPTIAMSVVSATPATSHRRTPARIFLRLEDLRLMRDRPNGISNRSDPQRECSAIAQSLVAHADCVGQSVRLRGRRNWAHHSVVGPGRPSRLATLSRAFISDVVDMCSTECRKYACAGGRLSFSTPVAVFAAGEDATVSRWPQQGTVVRMPDRVRPRVSALVVAVLALSGLAVASAGSAGAVLCPTADSSHFTVTSTSDSGTGTLRQAMADAQGNDGGSVCVDIGSQTSITLSSQITYSGTGLLTIVGNGATLVGGAHQSSGGIMQLSGVVSPTFFSETTLTVVVSDLSFTGGVAHDGGALWLEAVNATLNHVVMSANTADTRSVGGAIAAYNGSAIGAISLVINDSQFINNVDDCSGCGSDGGGAVMATFVGVVVNRSTFAGNSSSGPGGAINAPDAAVSVLNSTFNANTSVLGGAINAGTSRIAYSTFVGNSAATGSAIAGPSALSANVLTLPPAATGTLCSQAATSSGYNYANETADSCHLVATGDSTANSNDARLGPLADNGGLTSTMLPLAGSPVLEAIPPASCVSQSAPPAAVVVDQRGEVRPAGNGCEIGAVEAHSVTVFPHSLTYASGVLATNFGSSLSTYAVLSAPNRTNPTCSAPGYSLAAAAGTSWTIVCSGGQADGWSFDDTPTATLFIVGRTSVYGGYTPTASGITYGQPLSASILSGGVVVNDSQTIQAGTWAFVSPASVPAVGTALQDVTFTPTDPGYASFDAQVAVTVSAVSPSAPRSVKASPRAASSVVTWAAPSTSGGVSVVRYTVTASPNVGSSARTCSTSATLTAVAARTCTVTGLVNGVRYTFTVQARNGAGKESGSSAASSAVMAGAPSEPRSLSLSFPASPAQSAKVTWVVPVSVGSSAITGYRVRWYDTVAKTYSAWISTTAAARTASISGRVQGRSYQVQVQARNAVGLGPVASKAFTQP